MTAKAQLDLDSKIAGAAVDPQGYPQWLRKTPILLLILQPLIFFRHVFINPDFHIPFDIEGFHLPLIAYVARSVRHGITPLWDPLFYGGMPIHADSQAQLFYPFTWLAILAGNHSQGKNLYYWVEALVPLHMILVGLFTIWLMRRMSLRLPAALLGATVYQIGAFFASQAQHLGAICCAAWLPLTILAIFEARRQVQARWVAVLALSTAMTILAGFMATTVVVGVAALLMLAALVASREASWRLVPAVAAGFLIGTMISFVELAPLWHLTQASIASLRSNWTVGGGGLPIESLVSFVIPDYYHIFEPTNGYKLQFNYTFLYIYCGAATALLLALAPLLGRTRGRIFLAVTFVCAIWMLGEHTPVYRSIYVHLPRLLRGSLYAEYALMAFCFFGGITAALVLDRMRKYLPEAALWAIAVFTSFDLIHTGSSHSMNQMSGGYRESYTGYQSPAVKDLPDKLRELVNQTVPPSRIDYLDHALGLPEVGANLLELPTTNGNNPFMLRRMRSLRQIFCGGNPWERLLPVNRPGSPLLSMLNVRWLSAASPLSSDVVSAAGLETMGSVGGIWIYRNPHALPRFYLARRILSSPDEASTFQMLAEQHFDPWKEAVVENVPADRNNLATEPVTVELYEPNRVVLSVVTSGPAFLAGSEVMYDGWEAKVNGKPEPLLITNGAFRGLELPGGINKIVMEYHPPRLGIYLVFSSLLAVLAMAVVVSDRASWLAKSIAVNRPRLSWVEVVREKNVPHRLAGWLTEFPRKHATTSWLGLFVATVCLFYWKILLTRQFSLLTTSESINQTYSWLRFWISSVRHGIVPLWDPYTFGGHSFVGEMQTAAFYPLHILLALIPFDHNYMLSPYLYHAWWAGAHLLGGLFMFLLARELGLSRYTAFVSGICFSLGGFVGRVPWPHMLESSIWLPLIFLFFLRAIQAGEKRALASYASLGGLTLAMSVLAGGLQVVIMQAVVLVSAALFFAIVSGPSSRAKAQPWIKAGRVLAIFVTVGFAASAIQLLPSMEYSHHAVRFLASGGALPVDAKIPYGSMGDALAPHGVVSLIFPFAFGANIGSGVMTNPYLGVFTLLAAIIGIRRNWCCLWVRYLTGLAVLAFLYSFGPFSWLHGVLYAMAPRLWLVGEAPQMIYLADFSLALLAGFGIETLFSRASHASWIGLNRTLLVFVSACALCLFVPAVFGKPEISPWVSLSLLLIIASYGLFRYILNGHVGTTARVVLVILTLFDLSAFDWTARNVVEVTKGGVRHIDETLSLRGVADFLKTRSGRFRVGVMTDSSANIGDLFGVESVNGAVVTTLPSSYEQVRNNRDLLGVKYLVKQASAQDPDPIYRDSTWKVYENPTAFPRAWIVHQTVSEVSGSESPAFDPSRAAIVDGEIDGLEPAGVGAQEGATLLKYQPNSLEIRAHVQARGLLVLSETYDPGWHATVNGAPADVIKVDRDLRAVLVPAGDSDVLLDYRPWSVYAGAALSLLTFVAILYYSISNLRLRKPQSKV